MGNIPNVSFKKRIFVSGTVTALTGLHIGGSSTEMSIGGADSIVVRDPLTNYPYIPGSSLRGKMRSLLERLRGEMTIVLKKDGKQLAVNRVDDLCEPLAENAKLEKAGPATDAKSAAARLFGVAIDQQQEEDIEKILPQRLVVRDAKLINAEKLEQAKNTDMPLTEVKTEVAIDRITSKANPRQIERVPAGAEFRFEFILNLYGEDRDEEYLKLLFECMELLQDDYLGGHGSRGYGRVQFIIQSIKQKTVDDYAENRPGQPLGFQIPQGLSDRPEPDSST